MRLATVFGFLTTAMLFCATAQAQTMRDLRDRMNRCADHQGVCIGLVVLDGVELVIDSLRGVPTGRPKGYANYQCNAFGSLKVDFIDAQTGAETSAEFEVGGANDCRWFRDQWGERKSRIFLPTLIAMCDAFGTITKIRVTPEGQVTEVGREPVGTREDCLRKATLINNIP